MNSAESEQVKKKKSSFWDDDEDDAPKGPKEKKPKKEHSGFSLLLNKYFHHVDRGSHLRTEVASGILVFFLSICVLMMNLQIATAIQYPSIELGTSPNDPTNIAIATNIVAQYQASILIAFVGSLLIGLIANLPFVQLSLLSLSTGVVTYLSNASGLSYPNLLFLSFLSAILYAIFAGVPFLRKELEKAIPEKVRVFLPALAGVLLSYVSIQLSGLTKLVSLPTTSLSLSPASVSLSVNSLTGITLLAFIGGIVMIVCYFFFRLIKSKHPFLFSFLIGLAVFFLVDIIIYKANSGSTANGNSIINFGRVWVIMGSQADPATPHGDSYPTYLSRGFRQVFSSFGTVFTKGADFSAYEGNFALLLISTLLTNLAFFFYDPMAVKEATEEEILHDATEEEKTRYASSHTYEKLLYTNAAMNIIAPFFGGGAVLVSKTSVAGVKEKGRSGLVPIVASIGYLISLFLLAFPALFASSTYVVNSMNEFNYFAFGNGGFVQLILGLRYGFADALMALVGVEMVIRAFQHASKLEKVSYLPAIAGSLFALFFSSFVLGLFVAVILALCEDLLASEGDKKLKGKEFFADFAKNTKAIPASEYCLSLGLLLAIAL